LGGEREREREMIHSQHAVRQTCAAASPQQRCLRATASMTTSTTRNLKAVLQGKL